jgi:hypothetical protein
MTEQEVRALVRDVIARHAAGGPSSAAPSATTVAPDVVRRHASHGLFVLPHGADSDGPCIIEPSVACNHCGYCKSYGH